MIVPSGRMRERIVLQQAAVTVDAAGEPAYAWTDVATLWAQVTPAGGSTQTLAERRTAIDSWQVTIRWRAGMSPRQRIVWRGRYFEIEAVQNTDERWERLTLTCRDVGPTA